MASHGVKFSGVVDDYHGLGKFDCFHWFEEGSGSNYIDPMLESCLLYTSHALPSRHPRAHRGGAVP